MDNFKQESLENSDPRALRIAITSTFVAEPVEASIRFWMHELGIATNIAFAPFNQVFQQLLDPASLLATNHNGVNIVLVRLEDWQKDHSDSDPNANGSMDSCDEIERITQDFLRAFTTAVQRDPSTYLVCVCPSSTSVSVSPRRESFLRATEEQIASELSNVAGVELITASQVAAAYPVAEFYDSHTDSAARVPYTPVYYTALGTMIARRLYALKGAPYKVIALDCDGTLWSGVCGEDGAGGIQIDDARKSLQRFMVEQHERGRLICLCSKNNEDDALEVFDSRSDMILRRDHLTAWRVNWKPKSENLRSLAEELGLGVDSFIFIDDDPVQCAEVGENCPEVLTLQFPNDPESVPRFLNHIWALDPRRISEEDSRRTALYRQHAMRERVRRESLTFSDFLSNLNLDVHIAPFNQKEIGRVADLTLRTNQFNLTTIRRTEAEIRQLCEQGGECLIVRVKDRFGDYGLVGTMILQTHADSLIVDTFLLSCRALGRGVEHRMLARLGEMATQRGLSYVALRCIPSSKNRPALDFLEALSEGVKEFSENGFVVRFAANCAASVSYHPWTASNGDESTAEESLGAISTLTADARKRTALLSAVPETLYDPERIHKLITTTALQPRPDLQNAYVPPGQTIDIQLAQIWEDLLRVRPIGIRDSFFDLGGNSLIAVQMMQRIEQACGVLLPLSTLVAGPTIELLTKVLVEQRVKERGSLLVTVQPGRDKTPFFFLHGDFLGGGFYCLNLARALGEDQPFYSAAPYGVDGGPRPETVEAMAAGYVEMLRAVVPHGPYILGGLCHGGLIAFEMAQQLRRQGEQVDLVVMIGPQPSNPPIFRYLQDVVYRVGYLLRLRPEQQRNLFLTVRNRCVRLRLVYLGAIDGLVKAAKLPLGEQVEWALRSAKKLACLFVSRRRAEGTAGNPREAGWSEGHRQLHSAMAGYVRRPYPNRLALFWPIEEPVSMPDEPIVMWNHVTDRSLGWSQVAKELKIYEIPGGYTTAVTTHITLLADQTKACLNGAQTNGLHDGASRSVPQDVTY
jgi:FkbH-like protein